MYAKIVLADLVLCSSFVRTH